MPDENPNRSALEQLVRALRQARLQRELSVDEIGRLVKIRSAHIERLEAGDFTFLPPLYVYSSLRKYAEALGVGTEEQLAACRKELGVPDTRFSTKPAPADEHAVSGKPPLPSVSKRTIVLLAGGVALVLALLGLALLLLG
ncbi:MAG: helix-turn-helix domain-containing protein [Chlorobiaceae bacterium]|nr:helix-turn-helix domain-containing protein [Chlorobiaceae bacterium]